MPALLLHLTAIERLAAEASLLPPQVARALDEDLEYARLGAALPDLPRFQGMKGAIEPFSPAEAPSRFSQLFHIRAPVLLGLKMAELVSLGALVGTDAGHAFVAGYFTHLVIDRALQPIEERLIERHRSSDETPRQALARVEWTQALLYLREIHGQDLIGTSALRPKFQVLKRHGIPIGGIGGGLYETVRLSCREVLGEAPLKSDVDQWLRGLYLYGRLLSSPLGKARALPAYSNLSTLELYRSSEIDIAQEITSALDSARQVLTRLSDFMERGSFTRRARARFLADVPEAVLQPSAA
ncbi:MAG: zinc dependent phospholipase C family protein [Myxococcaceae bacterium]